SFAFFFFFQAEDGIRDFHVTGVQTCALPILSVRLEVPMVIAACAIDALTARASLRRVAVRGDAPHEGPDGVAGALDRVSSNCLRSEERRVGKECRARWCA